MCSRHPARNSTLTGRRPQNEIASAGLKWLILVEFVVFLSDLEGIKKYFCLLLSSRICTPHTSLEAGVQQFLFLYRLDNQSRTLRLPAIGKLF